MLQGQISDCVGKTPLIRIKSLSELTGCEIFGKAEYLNPGGSVKDRAALGIILQAEKDGKLKPGGLIVEGTAGNTGIGLATIAAERGYHCLIVMPDNQSKEKYETLAALGVELVIVPACPFADQNHFYHTARRLSEERSGSFWVNQFENLANFDSHYSTTAPEIWQQTGGKVSAFLAAAGTGGTLAGVSKYLKERNKAVHVRLLDPMGSILHSYVTSGSLSATGSTITEGIGIGRITENFRQAVIDDSMQVTDQQMISTIHHLATRDGLLVGTSAGVNVYGAYKYALEHKNSGKVIVTILCDSALRYQSKVFNEKYLAENQLKRHPLTV